MGFTSTDSQPQTVQKTTQPEDPHAMEPSPAELQEFLATETDMSTAEIANKVAGIQNEIQFLDDVAAHYLIGQRLDIDIAAAFETKQQDYSLDLANVRPEMTVTTTATISSVDVADPENKDWTRQDVVLEDDSGTLTLVLWNENIRSDLSEDDTVKLVDCWGKEHRGNVQVSLGKSGRIELI
jgi:hypothetical protein